ncbi:MAG: hypothetical protein KHZ79_06225 [Atopobium minutum]|uniref:Uncharacterized protein n=1 Tax=Atopobium minutum TaxID=1381 RepID=A0AB38A4T7_9ACTN|nr:hypothetical protein [Atopobium minutum]KRN55044.1 hypothetical protein IV72_GL000541 [Atopobium minutum]MBS4873951.1 hypothetical protein [Atopobium minutum]SEB43661.1 hypothetical protein SAMN04489746_0216 [Atopobium minutum]
MLTLHLDNGEHIRVARNEQVQLACGAEFDRVEITNYKGEKTEQTTDEFVFTDVPDICEVVFTNGGTFVCRAVVEVVERHYFSIDALKAQDDTNDFQGVTDEQFFRARQAATEVFEQNAHRSFVNRLGKTETYSGDFCWLAHNDVSSIFTPHVDQLSKCTVQAPLGHLVIEYIYGLDWIPARVSAAVMSLTGYYLRPSTTPERATGEAVDGGFIRFTLAGKDGATGLPEVDAVIEQYGCNRVIVL